MLRSVPVNHSSEHPSRTAVVYCEARWPRDGKGKKDGHRLRPVGRRPSRGCRGPHLQSCLSASLHCEISMLL
eukprot:935897-Alexandrium_andersonii.AAC.1